MLSRIPESEASVSGVERFLAVSVTLGGESPSPGAQEELASLVKSAGGEVVCSVTQKRNAPDSATFVGKGKVEELVAGASAADASSIVFDHNLAPAQVSRLEEATGCKVIDRTELILSIFARQARTAEAKMQVELAQLKYALPRLSGMWHHFSRLGGGIGTRGPGETQLEVDRRKARIRIRLLEKEIEKLSGRRDLLSRRRTEAFRIAITGYTNTGKSTLLNKICGSDALSADKLFATLDSTTRRLGPPGVSGMVFSDTVGFIERLPEGLVASFYSTLAVVREADLLLVVGDASNQWRDVQMETVRSTLDRIEAGSIPRLVVWNKADLVDPEARPTGGVTVSALTGEGIGDLIEAVERERDRRLEWFVLELADSDGKLEHWLHENCIVRTMDRTGGAISLTAGAIHGVEAVRSRLSQLESGGWSIREIPWSELDSSRGPGGRPSDG